MEHQFKKKTFYLPKWEVEYLFNNAVNGYYNPSKTKSQEDYTNYSGDAQMHTLYNKAKSILVK